MRVFVQSILSSLPRTWLERFAGALRRRPYLGPWYRKVAATLKERDGVIASGPARGLSFNTGQSDSRFMLGTFEPAVQHLLAAILRPGMVYYDVGANVGFFAMLAARLVGRTGQVHCFEPLPKNAGQILHNANINQFRNIHVHQTALAQIDSTAVFRVSERPTFGALMSSPIAVDRESGTLDVAVHRLDSMMAEADIPGPHVIKVDIEGSEADFLEGAESIIRRFKPVLILELHGTNTDVAERLKRLNYNADMVGGGTIEEAVWAGLAVGTAIGADELRSVVKSTCSKFSDR